VIVKLSADKMLFFILAVLPLFFMPYTIFVDGGKAKIFYDALYISGVFLLLLLMPWGGGRYVRQAFVLWWLSGLVFVWFAIKLFLLKFVVATDGYFYWVPYFREIKPGLYFLFCALFVSRWGSPSVESFVRAGTFFSCLVLVSFLIGLVFTGGGRPEVIDEANYDNFLVLLACMASFAKFGLRFDWRFVLFLLATLVSQSKTGVI
jgi:hypothetical protein